MKEILIAISIFSFKIGHFENATKEQVENHWLGFQPARSEEIKKTEKRLNLILPSDYKDFLKISNGFSTPSDIEPTFMQIEDIKFLRDVDKHTIESYSYLPELQNSILVAGKDEEQYFLLIPPQNENDNWKYWKFANWYSGEEEFADLNSYFSNVNKYLKKESEKNNCL